MTVRIEEKGAENLEKSGYCAAWNEETEELVIVRFETASVYDVRQSGPDVEVTEGTIEREDYETDGSTIIITEDSV